MRYILAASALGIIVGKVADIQILLLLAAILAGTPIALKAFRALRVPTFSIELLVTIASIGAIIVGNYWEAAAVTFLFVLGGVLEQATLARTRKALKELVDAAPETALRVPADAPASEAEEVDIWQLAPGDEVIVKNGFQIPVDGEIISGYGGIDESTITGESVPAERGFGDKVFAGTWLHSGHMRIKATGVGADTALAKIINRVEDAQDAKAKTQTFLEKFASWYTPAIALGSLAVGLYTQDVTLALTLLVIACPGALVISIPVSIIAGIGRAAKDSVLIKGGDYLEQAAKVDTVIVDKTGTLTQGKPEVTRIITHNGWAENDVLSIAAAAETASEHPLAHAIISRAHSQNLPISPVSDAQPVTAQGIIAHVDSADSADSADSERVSVGSLSLTEAPAADLHWATERADEVEKSGSTALVVSANRRIVGIIGVADTVRPDSATAIAQLQRRGIHIIMATGDNHHVAQAIAEQTGISDVKSGLLPQDKEALIASAQAEGKTVAMVGDGVNDTPALARADIGVAMGAAGTPAAIETADIALMSEHLSGLPHALHLARRTVRTMRINIAIALVVVAFLLAGVLFGTVNMALGMLVHEGSVLLVIAIAMLLLVPRKATTVAESGATSVKPASRTMMPDSGEAATCSHAASNTAEDASCTLKR